MAKKPKVFNAITPGDPLAFEDKRIDTLVGLYHGSKNRLRKIATETPTPAELWRANALLKQVDGEIAFLNEKAVEFSGKAASDSYRAGWRVTDKAAKAQGVTEAANWGALINTRAVKIVADQMAQDLITANQSMKGTFTRYIRATQQKIISENEINRMIGEGLISGATRRETSTAFYKQLTAQMKDDKFITIKGRNYDPEHYAELVARTRTREAATEGMINGALQCGMDLMQVSVHSHPRLDPCSPHQGRVYSISGTHPDFPKLVERPPYHCNCRHVISATNEATLRRRGQYDALVELSGNQPKDPTNRKSLEAWVKDDKPKMFADSREYYEYVRKAKENMPPSAVYMQAASAGDEAKAKKILDNALQEAGFRADDAIYHFSQAKDAQELATNIEEGEGGAFSNIGMFLTREDDFQGAYGGKGGTRFSVVVKDGKYFVPSEVDTQDIAEQFLRSNQGKDIFDQAYDAADELDLIKKVAEEMDAGEIIDINEILENADFTEWLVDEGYDGVDINGGNLIIYDPLSNVRFSDPILRDSDGNIISLEDRVRKLFP